MNTNETIRNTQDDVIELGVASVETQGGAGPSEATGIGLPFLPGISAE
ncbi:MAG: benenodin family lasso peptide [Dyella sp.]